ncbi:hypothetical protein NHX12_006159, partial [Muraenolepis orangiensis]
MTTLDCCGVGRPDDFEESLFRLISPRKAGTGLFLSPGDSFETYSYMAGALAIVVLTG